MSTTMILMTQRKEMERRIETLEQRLAAPRGFDETPFGRKLVCVLYALVGAGLILAGWLAMMVAHSTRLF